MAEFNAPLSVEALKLHVGGKPCARSEATKQLYAGRPVSLSDMQDHKIGCQYKRRSTDDELTRDQVVSQQLDALKKIQKISTP